MRRTLPKLVVTVALVAASAALGGQRAHHAPAEPAPETRIVPPLADPAVVPGIGRCTSDGPCTVTDADGTRRASRIRLAP